MRNRFIEMAVLEQQKAGDNVFKLAADQKVRVTCFLCFVNDQKCQLSASEYQVVNAT